MLGKMFRAVDVANVEQPSATTSRLKSFHADQLVKSLGTHARSASGDIEPTQWSEKIHWRLVKLLEARQLSVASETIDLNTASVSMLTFSEALGALQIYCMLLQLADFDTVHTCQVNSLQTRKDRLLSEEEAFITSKANCMLCSLLVLTAQIRSH